MYTDIIPYEPPHPHLLYTLSLTLIAWAIVEQYTRRSLRHLPGLRVILYGLLIVFPIYAEVGGRLIDYVRPAPDTTLGYMMAHFHAYVLNRIPIDSFLPPQIERMIVAAMFTISAFSIMRLLYGGRKLGRLLRPACCLDESGRAALAARIAVVARQASLRVPPILVLPLATPLAFTTGVLRPRIYITEQMLTILSEDEALAVLCHELAHVQRRDNLWNASVRVLRDILWFLPGGHLAWHAMIASQDEACDARAAMMTGEPLALARALVRVAGSWNGISLPVWPAATPFVLASNTLEARVRHMVAFDTAPTQRPRVPRSVYLLCALLLVLGVLPALLGS